jgi:hypothetical protein
MANKSAMDTAVSARQLGSDRDGEICKSVAAKGHNRVATTR